MKPIDYYTTNPLPRPTKSDYMQVFAYSRGKIIWQGPAREFETARRHLDLKGPIERLLNEEAYHAAVLAYQAESTRLQREFKHDLLEDHGVTNHPKAELCFKLAWEYGHDSGLKEIANCFDDFVDLIKS